MPTLGQEPTFTFSGTQRARYESLDGQFLASLDKRDEVLALQTSLLFESRFKRLSLVGEILDSRAALNDDGSFVNNTVVNTLEPLQAYVAWTGRRVEQAGVERSLRVGRMTLDLGKRRVISRNRFRNTVNNFVGADWRQRHTDGGELRAFYLLPMRHLPADRASVLDNELEFDRASRDTRVLGGFYQFPALAGGDHFEVYGLDYDAESRDPAADAHHFSLGGRAYRQARPGAWHYEIEAIVQAGESGGGVGAASSSDLRHSADFAHIEIGYAFEGPWATTAALQYDRASGDRDPLDDRNQRFNTLFGDRRFDFGPTGIFGPFQRSNLVTPGVRITVTPSPRWQAMLSYRSFRLESRTDAWIGTDLRDVSGTAGRSLATQLEAAAIWAAIPERLSLDFGLAAVKLGSFARQTLGTEQRAARYWYAAVTTTF